MPETYDSNLTGQPAVLRRLIDGRDALAAAIAPLAAHHVTKAFFVGSGTSNFAGEIAAGVWSHLLDVDVACVPTLSFLNDVPASRFGPATLVVAISQSGGTKALVAGVERARSGGSPTIAVTADTGSPLAAVADIVVDAMTGQESIFAKTKGFTTTALAAALVGVALAEAQSRIDATTRAALAATLAELPAQAADLIADTTMVGADLAQRFTGAHALAVVGAGAQLPAAREGALKVLEVAKLPVLAFELEESLHGPFNTFGPGVGLLLLAGAIPQPDKAAAFVRAAQHIGAPLVTIAEPRSLGPATVPDEDGAVRAHLRPDIGLPALPYPRLSPILGVLPLQVLASRIAALRGVDPNVTRYPELYAVFRTKAGHGEEVTPPSPVRQP